MTQLADAINTLERQVKHFRKERNISQKELFEVVLIEFFCKYCYKNMVEQIPVI